MQIEEIFEADEQLTDGLGVYEIMPEQENDDDPENEDPVKMYSTGEKRFDEPTSTVEEPTKEINLGTENDPQIIIINLNPNPEEESALIKVLKALRTWIRADSSSGLRFRLIITVRGSFSVPKLISLVGSSTTEVGSSNLFSPVEYSLTGSSSSDSSSCSSDVIS